MTRSAVFLVALLAVIGLSPVAHAAPAAEGSAKASVSTSGARASASGLGPSGKRFRFHLGTDVLSLVHFNPDGQGNEANSNRLGFGIGRRTLVDWPTGGLGGGVASLGFGGVILGGHGVVGAAFAFAVDGLDVGDDGGTGIEGRFVPYFNYMFNPSGRVTPFLGAHFGLGGGAFVSRSEEFGTMEELRTTTNVIYPLVGLQGGVHVFIIPAVSVDAMLNFDYLAPFARTVTEGGTVPDTGDDDYDKTGDLINVAFASVGISAWF